jgi:hypothetical protein
MQKCTTSSSWRKLRIGKYLGIEILRRGAGILPIFYIVANQRRRKILVHSVDCPVGVTDNSKML